MAINSGDARLQERAPKLLSDISNFSASQMNDPMSLAMNLQAGLVGKGGGVSVSDYLQSMDIMAGGNVSAQQLSFLQRYKTFGGDEQQLSAAKSVADITDQRSLQALVALQSQTGQAPQQLIDMLKVAISGASGAAQSRQNALKSDTDYQRLTATPDTNNRLNCTLELSWERGQKLAAY
jgi:hypothetical protein